MTTPPRDGHTERCLAGQKLNPKMCWCSEENTHSKRFEAEARELFTTVLKIKNSGETASTHENFRTPIMNEIISTIAHALEKAFEEGKLAGVESITRHIQSVTNAKAEGRREGLEAAAYQCNCIEKGVLGCMCGACQSFWRIRALIDGGKGVEG